MTVKLENYQTTTDLGCPAYPEASRLVRFRVLSSSSTPAVWHPRHRLRCRISIRVMNRIHVSDRKGSNNLGARFFCIGTLLRRRPLGKLRGGCAHSDRMLWNGWFYDESHKQALSRSASLGHRSRDQVPPLV